jgi:hypothetical protein
MSGSPVLLSDVLAIGIVCAAAGADPRVYTEGGPNPRLAHNLPGWCLQAFAIDWHEAAVRSAALLLSGLCSYLHYGGQ